MKSQPTAISPNFILPKTKNQLEKHVEIQKAITITNTEQMKPNKTLDTIIIDKRENDNKKVTIRNSFMPE